jgi:hypothetical protein
LDAIDSLKSPVLTGTYSEPEGEHEHEWNHRRTHIAESESMWNLIDQSMYHRRPVMVSAPDDTLYRDFNVPLKSFPS